MLQIDRDKISKNDGILHISDLLIWVVFVACILNWINYLLIGDSLLLDCREGKSLFLVNSSLLLSSLGVMLSVLTRYIPGAVLSVIVFSASISYFLFAMTYLLHSKSHL